MVLYNCYLCPLLFDKALDLALHLSNDHPSCHTCYSRFSNHEFLFRHRCIFAELQHSLEPIAAQNVYGGGAPYIPILQVQSGTWENHLTTGPSEGDSRVAAVTPQIHGKSIKESKAKAKDKTVKASEMVKFACSSCATWCRTAQKLEKHQKQSAHGRYKSETRKCNTMGCTFVYIGPFAERVLKEHHERSSHGQFQINSFQLPGKCCSTGGCRGKPKVNHRSQALLDLHIRVEHNQQYGNSGPNNKDALPYLSEDSLYYEAYQGHGFYAESGAPGSRIYCCPVKLCDYFTATHKEFKKHLRKIHQINKGYFRTRKALFTSAESKDIRDARQLTSVLGVLPDSEYRPPRFGRPLRSSVSTGYANATANSAENPKSEKQVPVTHPPAGNFPGAAVSSNSNPSSSGFQCMVPSCTQNFIKLLDLHRHEKKEHSNPLQRTFWVSKSQKLKCTICSKKYWESNSLKQHVDLKHTGEALEAAKPIQKAVRDYHCLDCKIDFPNLKALNSHLATVSHIKAPVTAPTLEAIGVALNKCLQCDRQFKSSHAYQAHMGSSKHKPLTPGLVCIRPGCGRKFNSPSAMLGHVESGGCSPDMDRNFVNRLIVQNDPTGIITDHDAVARAPPEFGLGPLSHKTISWGDAREEIQRPHLREGLGEIFDESEDGDANIATPTGPWNDEDESDGGSFGGVSILTPDTFASVSSSPGLNNKLFTPQSGTASGNLTPVGPRFTRNHIFPEYLHSRELILLSARQSGETEIICPLCPRRRVFTLRQLESHLTSAAHAPKIFHCPTSILGLDLGKGKKHMRSFSTLSGLTQHVESEACKGGKGAFEKVVLFVEAKLKELGFENGFGSNLMQTSGLGGFIEADGSAQSQGL